MVCNDLHLKPGKLVQLRLLHIPTNTLYMKFEEDREDKIWF